MPYEAFVSYSHAVDGQLAPGLQSALHRLAKPWYRLRALRVFRDKASLSANPGLWPSIERALAESEFFLLLASPEAARSPWVEREVGWWLAHRAADRLLIVLTGGELIWDDAARDFDWARTTAVSPLLRGRFTDEPLYVDLRWARTADDLSLRHSQFRAAALDVAATLHGRPKDDLDGEDVRHHRAARRLATAAVCLLVALTIVAGGAAYLAQRRAVIAERRREEAERQRRIAVGRQLAAEAEVARTQAALLPRSMLLAVEAARRLDALGVHSAEIDHTLRDGLALLPARGESLPQTDVLAAAMSADGRRVAAVGHDGSAHVWEVDGRREIARVASGGRLSAAAFSPDLAWLATVGDDDRQAVQVRDVASGELRFRFVNDGWVTVLAFAPDGRALAAGGLDPVVRVVTLPDGREITRLAHGSAVNAIAWSRDGGLIATGTGSTADRMGDRPPRDEAAHVWDVHTGQRLVRLAHDHVVQAVAFAPDASLLATGSLDRTARLWDVRTGSEIARVLHEDGVAQVAFAPDGRSVASGSQPYIIGWQNQTVRVWDTSGREIGRVVHEGGVRSIAFSPDGRYLASAGSDHTARLLDASGREIARTVLDHPVEVCQFSADGGTMLAAGGELRVWPTGPGFEATPLEERHAVYQMSFSADGTRLATVGGATFASLWVQGRDGEPLRLEHGDYVVDVAFDPAGHVVATAGNDGTTRLWDAATGAPYRQLAHDGKVRRVAFSSDGRRIATASEDGMARVWDVTTGGQVARLEHGEDVFALRFAPDGRFLATGSQSGAIRIWNIASGREEARTAVGLGIVVRDLLYSPDGAHLVAAGYGNVAALFDAATGTEVARLTHDREVVAVAYAPGGLLATAAVDGVARLWDPTGRETARFRHDDALTALAFSRDGRYLATASSDRTARVWDLADLREVVRLPHPTTVNAVAFSPDGRRLATASGEPFGASHVVRLWRWQPRDLIREACRRLARNLSWEEWQDHFSGTPYHRTCKHLPTPTTVLVAYLDRADAAARGGRTRRAELGYARLVREATAIDDGRVANAICWRGSLDGSAARVLPVCERAVALLPELPEIRDSRGLARALTGNVSGAIEDFSAYIASAGRDGQSAERTADREVWVAALREGRNPFDTATLAALREREG
jgi:WD40 repeat protein